MIPSLTRTNSLTQRKPEWPDGLPSSSYPSGALFEARPALRNLVVLADADLLAAPDDPTLSPKTVLTGLVMHPYIKVLRYRDEGPPADIPRRSYGPPAAELNVAEGWAEMLPPDRGGVRAVRYMDGSLIRDRAVFGAGIAQARRNTGSAVYADRDPGAGADQRERDVLVAEAAQAIEADLFITERPYLFGLPPPVVQGATLCRTAEALAMVALYLRSQHEFVMWCLADGTRQGTNEWLYYQVGAVELLHGLWRWSAARAQTNSERDKEALSGLHDALIQRIVRALWSRDSFHRAYSLPQNRDAVRTMLVELDTMLVMLMGAVDASARFMHILLGFPAKKRRDAGWQRPGWCADVAKKDAALAGLFKTGTTLAHTLRILALLRNTVHSEAIRATIRQKGRSRDAVIRLPSEHQQEILDSMDAVGGREAWGVRGALNGSPVVDPGPFVEQLFPRVLALLNAVMEHTPASGVDRLRQYGDGPRWFCERNRLSIRWQLGF